MSMKYIEEMSRKGISYKKFNSAFGAKILEKFGWKEGEGLGKSKNGITEAIQIKRREENMGLGKTKKEVMWNDKWWEQSYNNILKDIKPLHNEKKEKNSLKIPVVINAGGRGTRLDPFTKVLPKPLIPVGELPIIELIMQEYQSYACDDFHIIVNYKKDLMKAYFHDSENHYNITWYDEDEPLGTGGGLSLLRGKLNSTFFFANCDALLTANYESMLKFHKENGNVITMICAYKNINIPYGVVEMGEQGVIESMKEKPLMSFLTNTGIYIVEPEVIYDIGDNEVIGFPDIVEREKQKGRKVAVFPVSENDWMDMGQLPELEKMRMKLYGE